MANDIKPKSFIGNFRPRPYIFQMSSYQRAQQPPSTWLFVAMAITVGLWQLPFGLYILYPFTILSTWFHEMGHGLTAMLLGGEFITLVLLPNGSGYALTTDTQLGDIGRALVSAGGPLGPAFAGAAFIYASKSAKATRLGLIALAIIMWVSSLIWLRSLTGLIIIPAIGVALVVIANTGPQWFRAFTVQFLGLQAFISMFLQWDYLFTHYAYLGNERIVSDTGQMAEALGPPHWFWAGVIVAIAGAILLSALKAAYGNEKRRY
ncbi:MAG: M50 family metallopeptidase [Pseudomonadota bacterium]